MDRTAAQALDAWLVSPRRTPLVLRGARQVGKTWLIRDLAARSGRELTELNFEREPRLARYFESNDPREILGELSLALNREITPARSLLFLDELQAAGSLVAKLRWFAEELPELPVVAAGSLLDFTLADHSFSMPVGRISFLHIEPMGFDEYLRAHDQLRLLSTLQRWKPGVPYSHATHDKATQWFHRYGMVGGMPAVVAEDVARGDPRACRSLQQDLMATYRADFASYAGRLDRSVLDSVLSAVARSIGQKFVYARVGEGVKQHQAKQALELLAAVRLCHLVRHSSANGIPLGGEVKESFRKVILLDVGLLHALLGTPATTTFPAWDDLAPQVRGQLTDQIAGQQLLGQGGSEERPLFYWQREGGRPGEIDYLTQIGGRIVPIELKAGASGSMKSLQHFMSEKKLRFAVRFDANPPSDQQVAVTTTAGGEAHYRLLNLPMYLAWALPEILDTLPKPGRVKP